MITRVTLNKKLRVELAAQRQHLARLLGSATKDQNRAIALDKERDRLQKAVETFETAQSLSDGDASKLSIKREQLRQCLAQIAAAAERPGSEQEQAEMTQLLLQFRNLLHRAVAPIQDQITQKLARHLWPFFEDGQILNQIIPQSIPMQNISNFMSVQWGMGNGGPCPQAREALRIIDTLLAGKCPIKF